MLSENPSDPDELLKNMFEDEHYKTLAEEDGLFAEKPGGQLEYISRIVRGVGMHSAELDGYIEKFAPYKDRPGMNTIYLSLLELKKGNVIEALDIVKKMGTVNK